MEGPRLSLESTRVLRRRNLVALGTTVIASIVLGACGNDGGTIPAQTARAMLVELGDTREQFDASDCLAAADRATQLNLQVQELSSKVDGQLRNALEEGSENLKLLIEESDTCLETPVEPSTTTTAPTTTDTSTTDTTTTDTTTTDTTTTDTTTDTTTTDPATTTTDPGGTGGTGGPGG